MVTLFWASSLCTSTNIPSENDLFSYLSLPRTPHNGPALILPLPSPSLSPSPFHPPASLPPPPLIPANPRYQHIAPSPGHYLKNLLFYLRSCTLYHHGLHLSYASLPRPLSPTNGFPTPPTFALVYSLPADHTPGLNAPPCVSPFIAVFPSTASASSLSTLYSPQLQCLTLHPWLHP